MSNPKPAALTLMLFALQRKTQAKKAWKEKQGRKRIHDLSSTKRADPLEEKIQKKKEKKLQKKQEKQGQDFVFIQLVPSL